MSATFMKAVEYETPLPEQLTFKTVVCAKPAAVSPEPLPLKLLLALLKITALG